MIFCGMMVTSGSEEAPEVSSSPEAGFLGRLLSCNVERFVEGKASPCKQLHCGYRM